MKLTSEEAKRIAWSLKDYASNMGMILHIYTSDPLFECKNPMLALGEMMAQREIMHRTTPLVQDAVDSIYGQFVRALYEYWSKRDHVPDRPQMNLMNIRLLIKAAGGLYTVNFTPSPFLYAEDRELPVEHGRCEMRDDPLTPPFDTCRMQMADCRWCKHYVPVSDKEKEA